MFGKLTCNFTVLKEKDCTSFVCHHLAEKKALSTIIKIFIQTKF